MKKKKIKLFVVPVMYLFSILMLIGGVYVIEKAINSYALKSKSVPTKDVDEVIHNDDVSESEENIPVVAEEAIIRRPYNNGGVKVVLNFYDYKADSSVQEGAIVYYGNTYMQNSGIDYGLDTEFEVVSVLDGTVMEVSEDDVMGKTVKIKHNNDFISVYQSLGSVDVKENDTITQGMIIGKSGLSNVSRDLGNHLHFEVYYQGHVMNPDDCYDKTLSALN